MFTDILFPTDGSEPADAVLDYVLAIAAEHGATVHVLNVVDTTQDGVGATDRTVVDALEADGEEIVETTAQRVRDRDVSVVTDVRHGDPYRTIVEYSDQTAVDAIVMPTHGRRGIHRYLLGSVTERVINTASVPVVAVNPDRDRPLTYPPRRVLVPTDGSRGAELALASGIDVARATGATLHLLHVVETGDRGPGKQTRLQPAELTGRAKEIVAEATERVEASGVETVTSVFEHREPATVIREYVDDQEIDLAVLGTHGQTDFSRYVMGGVSAKIVRTSPIPVLWVRDPDSDANSPA